MEVQRTFSIKQAFSFGWEATKKQFSFLLLITIIMFAVSLLFGYVEDTVRDSAGLSTIVNIISWLLQVVIGMVLIKIALVITSGKHATWSDVIKPHPYFLNYLGGVILTSLIVVAGFFALIIPGIYLAIRLQFVSYLIVDVGLGPIDAIKQSFAITRGQTFDLLVYIIVAFLVNLAGMIVFFVGLLVTIPLTLLATAFIYRELMGHTVPAPIEAHIGDAVPTDTDEPRITAGEEEDNNTPRM